MRFRNQTGKPQFAIFSLRDGEWDYWNDAETEPKAKKMLCENYLDDNSFAVVRMDYTMICRGSKEVRDG